MMLVFRSGVFHSAQEKQPGDVFARLSSRNDDSELVDGSKVSTFWPVWVLLAQVFYIWLQAIHQFDVIN